MSVLLSAVTEWVVECSGGSEGVQTRSGGRAAEVSRETQSCAGREKPSAGQYIIIHSTRRAVYIHTCMYWVYIHFVHERSCA